MNTVQNCPSNDPIGNSNITNDIAKNKINKSVKEKSNFIITNVVKISPSKNKENTELAPINRNLNIPFIKTQVNQNDKYKEYFQIIKEPSKEKENLNPLITSKQRRLSANKIKNSELIIPNIYPSKKRMYNLENELKKKNNSKERYLKNIRKKTTSDNNIFEILSHARLNQNLVKYFFTNNNQLNTELNSIKIPNINSRRSSKRLNPLNPTKKVRRIIHSDNQRQGKKLTMIKNLNASTIENKEGCISDYIFGKQIGQGAYSIVKEGIHKYSGKHVAIKFYDKLKLLDPQRKKSLICHKT